MNSRFSDWVFKQFIGCLAVLWTFIFSWPPTNLNLFLLHFLGTGFFSDIAFVSFCNAFKCSSTNKPGLGQTYGGHKGKFTEMHE